VQHPPRRERDGDKDTRYNTPEYGRNQSGPERYGNEHAEGDIQEHREDKERQPPTE
jgi:hypothetical protein